jgi:hypothetical protein
MGDLIQAGVAYAEVYRGMWIARCPQPWCDNAVALPLGVPVMLCYGDRDACGRESPVIWPRDPIAIATVLAMRPAAKIRNWLPHETVHDLLAENAEHGMLPDDWTESGRLVLARTADGMVTDGVLAAILPAGREIHQLGGQ